jgi:aspartyl/asparaginyl-tRNA synthetase
LLSEDTLSSCTKHLTEKYAKKLVIVMNYPKATNAFYMPVNNDGRTVAAMDVLALGIGEIIGGSKRRGEKRSAFRHICRRRIALCLSALRFTVDTTAAARYGR